MDARVDITDHYAFKNPGDHRRTVLIMNVNPLAPTHANEFRSDAVYETLIDTDEDAQPNIAFRYRFTPKQGDQQFATVTRAELEGSLEDGHLHGKEKTLVEHAPVSFGADATVTKGREDVLFFAGLRSDPFFFDLAGFLAGFKFTGSDFFANLNVFGIALEVHDQLLGNNSKIGVWVRTLVPMTLQPDHLTQADQMGRPAINTVFNHGAEKIVFNGTQPADQRSAQNGSGKTYLESFEETLQSFGYSAGDAENIAEILLPDILTFDYSSTDGFLNGRRLQDDVIDIELNLVTKGTVTTDGVGPHTDYLSVFPFLGNPHP
jgi:hypothetical protein